MDPERWSLVNDLVAEALARPPEERRSLLAACHDDEIRKEAASLLAQDSRLIDRLERSPAALADPDPELGPGERVGAYRVVQELGRGGMGVVYLAERADQEFERRVAVKVLKRGLETAEVVRRFRTERQILARLEHPGIAALFEGGTTRDGRPYFVMEHVEGRRIDRFCEERRLGVRERLELLRRVCDAVALAHRNLVVHGDLKPANILVTDEGAPKLLDFGIAKLLRANTAADATALTAGARPMTLEYASPEQVVGESLTTATDVYSLGVLLYELLAGVRPFRRSAGGAPRSPDDLRRAVREEEPVAPSVAGDRRSLRGDLDTIVLTALAKDPHRRYPSVERLSEDVRRHLEGRPVRARRPTLLYRAGKFARRNGKAVAAALVVLVAAAGFLAEREIQQRRTAQALERAERVSELMVDLFEVADPTVARGETVTAREVLDAGVERVRRDLVDEPEVRADLLQTMGRVYRNLGLYDAAEPLLGEAVELWRLRPGATGDRLAESLLESGRLHFERGDLATAERQFREALGLAPDQPLHPVDLGGLPRARRRHSTTASLLNDLGLVHHARGEHRAAESLYRQALDLHRSLGDGALPEVATELNNLGAVLRRQGDEAEAEAMYRQSLAIRRRLYGHDHPEVAVVLNSLGMLRGEQGDYEGGAAHLRQALAIERRVYREDHPMLALVLGNLCGVLHAAGSYPEAETGCREALDMSRSLLGRHPRVAAILVTLGTLSVDQGRAGEAEPLLREAIEMFRDTLPAGHWRTATARNALGYCLLEMGRAGEAEPLLLESAATLRREAPPASRHRRIATERLEALPARQPGAHATDTVDAAPTPRKRGTTAQPPPRRREEPKARPRADGSAPRWLTDSTSPSA